MAELTECEFCNRTDLKTWFCSGCTTTFCDECWPKQIQHRPGKRNLDGRPHVKENKRKIELMHSILEPSGDAQTLRNLHAQDQDTRWFGVIKSMHGGPSQFHDFRRYAQLMLDSRPLDGASRYPKLVSFIGDTNAGKSTIVKALVTQGSWKLGEEEVGKHQTPVPGTTENEGIATSEGVHLYADPALLQSERPVLYADCEGLNAGERPPFATEVATKGDVSNARRLQARLQPRIRDIKWTKGGDPNSGTREFAVGQLYPRFLYTFSDVIVFIQKNPRQIHQTYKYLVDWAKYNVEESINQPILPHAVVVLNAVEIGHSEQRWTVKDATDSFFRDVSGAVVTDPELRRLAGLRNIDPSHEKSSRELLECFYSKVHVIRIPAKRPERYSLIDEQIQELRRLIVAAGDDAHRAKVITRRLNDVDTLQEYLQAGFDHFAAKIDEPFDFKSVCLRTRTIAQDFGDHIINLASTIQEHTRVRGKTLFQGLVSLVASCILLDYVRNNLPGSLMDYFPNNYAPLCKAALYRFCDEHVPCEFKSKKCPECKNDKSAHAAKGHQNEKGQIIDGDYVSSFEAKTYESEWIESLRSRMKSLEEAFDAQRTRQLHSRDRGRPAVTKGRHAAKARSEDEIAAVRLHSETLIEFFSQSSSGQQCFSNSTCFGCLMAVPETPLPCGHAFCKSCISEHGQTYNDLVTYLKRCPLHPREEFDWEVQQKPEFAGIRILTLDGGGIRGIVELEILKAIESRINVGPANSSSFIPVQRFFDLIVGTSTGGIIALGLTVKRWSVDQCISKFVGLCDKAFSPRELYGGKLEKLATLHHGSKWKTKPLHEALQEAFGYRPMFGGNSSDSQKYATKVAVVSTSQSDGRSLVMTNYNREEPSDPGYSLELSDDPKDVLRIWEAAAATSAAPSIFKPLECRGKTYLDGALNHNNPVSIAWREKKLIWPAVPAKGLDILVSLGTGQNKSDIDAKLKKGSTAKPKRNPSNTVPATKAGPHKRPKNYRAWNGLKNYFSVLVNKIDNILDTEKAWADFTENVVGERWSTEDSARYIRLNPDLRQQVPHLDEKQKLPELQSRVQSLLKTDTHLRRTVEDIANRLFASSFFFKNEEIRADSNISICSGSLHSKFERKPQYIEQLGFFLKNQLLKDFVPKFVVSRQLSHADARSYDSMERYEWTMDREFIDNLIAKKEFDLGKTFDIEVTERDEPTYICLQLRTDNSRGEVSFENYPISGFPRRFLSEKERTTSRLQKRKADIERFRSKQKINSVDGEPINASNSGVHLPRSFGLVRTTSPKATRSRNGSRSPPAMYESDSDREYDSEEEIEKQMERLRMVDSDVPTEPDWSST